MFGRLAEIQKGRTTAHRPWRRRRGPIVRCRALKAAQTTSRQEVSSRPPPRPARRHPWRPQAPLPHAFERSIFWPYASQLRHRQLTAPQRVPLREQSPPLTVLSVGLAGVGEEGALQEIRRRLLAGSRGGSADDCCWDDGARGALGNAQDCGAVRAAGQTFRANCRSKRQGPEKVAPHRMTGRAPLARSSALCRWMEKQASLDAT
jgi:hypothetical protein